MDKFDIREIEGYRYAICGSMLIDTVPAGYANKWLESAPDADTLILCNSEPFPESVRKFRQKHPRGRIIAPYYTAFALKGILGADFECETVRDEKKIGEISFLAISRSGKGSFLKASKDQILLWSGAELSAGIDAVQYDTPTVAVIYISGCDYTEIMAGKIAEGIINSGAVGAELIDLRTEKTDDVISRVVNAAGILIGTSSSDGDAPKEVWDLLTAMNAGLFGGKLCGVFSSCTWDTGAAANVTERLRQLKMKPVDEGFTIQYKPDELAMNSIYEYGYDFGCKVQNVPNTHRSKLVKCLVCGEIFDASLGVCPVCGVGMDKCVPVEDEVINHKEDTDRTYLCVGGGIASLSAAEAIRRRDRTGTIIMISQELSPPVNRPMLTKNMVVAARVENSITVKDPDWFNEKRIELRLGTSVVSIDPVRKTAALDTGEELKYDKLIYGAGAECFVPPIAGSDKKGVFTIRHISDVTDMWKMLPKAKKAVVIGAGALGLEAAAELRKMRLDVTVLESGPRPMPRLIDEETSDALIQAAEDYGVSIIAGVNITEITGKDCAESVKLDDGRVFAADIVVISCGVRASVGPAKTAGVECVRAIVVSKYMETNVPDIYAAGDCAEIDGINYQLWAEATEQGRVAGANAAGDRTAFVSVPLGASFEGMNTAMYALGDVGKNGLEYRTVEYRNEMENSFRRYWFADGKLTGGILFGNTEKVPVLNEAIEKGRDYFSIKDAI